MERTPVVVLGMHRSGTSAVTRALGLLGVSLGHEGRLQGEWENEPLLRINERLLRRLGGAWGAPPEAEPGWWRRPEIIALEAEARSALTESFPVQTFAWKDPRLCITLPFWRPLLGGEPVVVLVVRHPLEVAASLERRDRFTPERSVALWEVYLRGALDHAEGLRAVVVQYSDLLADPLAGCTALEAALRSLGVVLERGDVAAAAESLEGDRRHHHADGPAPERHLSRSQLALWEAARGIGPVHREFVAPAIPEMTPESVDLLENLSAERREARGRPRAYRRTGVRLRKVRRGWRSALRRFGLAGGPLRAREMLDAEGDGDSDETGPGPGPGPGAGAPGADA